MLWPGVELPARIMLNRSFDVPDDQLTDLPDLRGTVIERATDGADHAPAPGATAAAPGHDE